MSTDDHGNEHHAADPAVRHRRHAEPLPIVADAATASKEDTAAGVLHRLRNCPAAFKDVVHVVDAQGRVRGAVPLSVLVASPPAAPVASLMRPAAAVTPAMFPEHVASHALRHALLAVPVVDRGGHLLGVVPANALMEILRREHVEDLHRMAGIRHETAVARDAIEAPPVRRARDRLPWLLVGLAGSMVATFVMARFEAALQAKIALAFFVPAIVYLADAIGTQTEAIAVRGLSLSHAPMRALVWGEMRTGLLIGLALGALVWPAIAWVFDDRVLATAVALSLIAAGTVATTIGLLLPWTLARLGRDPALGSGPLATIVQDVLSLAIYFAIAVALISSG
jgi:magnesium transporter